MPPAEKHFDPYLPETDPLLHALVLRALTEGVGSPSFKGVQPALKGHDALMEMATTPLREESATPKPRIEYPNGRPQGSLLLKTLADMFSGGVTSETLANAPVQGPTVAQVTPSAPSVASEFADLATNQSSVSILPPNPPDPVEYEDAGGPVADLLNMYRRQVYPTPESNINTNQDPTPVQPPTNSVTPQAKFASMESAGFRYPDYVRDLPMPQGTDPSIFDVSNISLLPPELVLKVYSMLMEKDKAAMDQYLGQGKERLDSEYKRAQIKNVESDIAQRGKQKNGPFNISDGPSGTKVITDMSDGSAKPTKLPNDSKPARPLTFRANDDGTDTAYDISSGVPVPVGTVGTPNSDIANKKRIDMASSARRLIKPDQINYLRVHYPTMIQDKSIEIYSQTNPITQQIETDVQFKTPMAMDAWDKATKYAADKNKDSLGTEYDNIIKGIEGRVNIEPTPGDAPRTPSPSDSAPAKAPPPPVELIQKSEATPRPASQEAVMSLLKSGNREGAIQMLLSMGKSPTLAAKMADTGLKIINQGK